jgi:putative DNA polymerase-related protein, bacteriophage-type
MDTLRDTLSERQRAMLAEMGIRTHWLPRAKARPAKEKGPCQPGAAAPEARAEAAPAGPKAPARTPETPGTPETPKAPARPEAPAASAQAVADMDWPALQTAVAQCQACGLCETRRQTVFGAGARQARWMVVGEAPGEQEDRQGQPFVGPAGKLLDAMLAAMGLSRHADDAIDALEKRAGQAGQEGQAGGPPAEGVYIANVLKCRPPGNRNPQPDEVARCEPYLRRQVALVQPQVILAMGRFAVQSLLQTSEPIGRLRGRVHQYAGVPVIVTYHPSYLLRNPPDKARAWQDLCLALQVMREQTQP